MIPNDTQSKHPIHSNRGTSPERGGRSKVDDGCPDLSGTSNDRPEAVDSNSGVVHGGASQLQVSDFLRSSPAFIVGTQAVVNFQAPKSTEAVSVF